MLDTNELRILCVFCNAPWTAKMVEDLYVTQGCDTCGYGAGVYGSIEVICTNCSRVVYRKEIDTT